MDIICTRRKMSILEKILDGLCCIEEIEITLPAGIIERTELMCLYIKEETHQNFDISDFLFLLYKDFIYYAVKNPNPKRILKEAGKMIDFNKKASKEKNNEDEYVKIVCDGIEYIEKINKKKDIIKNNEINKYDKVAIIKIDKKEARKGRIILEELYCTMGVYITLEELFASLWINFIEDYRNGINKRAYKSIISMLKKVGLE